MLPLQLLAVLALEQDLATIDAAQPPIPSRESHSIAADCRGRRIDLAYTISRPGPDMFGSIAIGGQALPEQEVARLNQMLGGYMLDDVSIYSCEGKGADFEVRLHLRFSRGEERHNYLVAIKSGRFRLIR